MEAAGCPHWHPVCAWGRCRSHFHAQRHLNACRRLQRHNSERYDDRSLPAWRSTTPGEIMDARGDSRNNHCPYYVFSRPSAVLLVIMRHVILRWFKSERQGALVLTHFTFIRGDTNIAFSTATILINIFSIIMLVPKMRLASAVFGYQRFHGLYTVMQESHCFR